MTPDVHEAVCMALRKAGLIKGKVSTVYTLLLETPPLG